jgi:hypothetical protein
LSRPPFRMATSSNPNARSIHQMRAAHITLPTL